MWSRPRNREDGGGRQKDYPDTVCSIHDEQQRSRSSRFQIPHFFHLFPTSPPAHQTIKQSKKPSIASTPVLQVGGADVAMAQAEKSRLHGTHQWDLGFEPRGARRRGARAWTMVGQLEAYARLTHSIHLSARSVNARPSTHHSPSSQ